MPKSLEEIFGKPQGDQQGQVGQKSLADIFGQQSQGQAQAGPVSTPSAPNLATPETESPLTLVERTRLSFANPEGREEFLKNRFNFVERLPDGRLAVGDDPRNLTPIDPKGFLNDIMGDMADVVGEIPIIAGQITGATLGSAAGPGGTVLGGATGAAVGEAARIKAARQLGVRKATAIEDATDIAIVGAFGAAGEGVAALSKTLMAKGAKKVFSKTMSKTVTEATKQGQGHGTEFLAKTFKITAGVPEDATRIAAKHGFDEVFTPKFLSEEGAVPIINQITKAVKIQKTRLETAVGKSTSKLVKGTKNSRVVDLKDTFRQLTQDLQEIGVLQAGNIYDPRIAPAGSTQFLKLLRNVGREVTIKTAKTGRFGKQVGKRQLSQFVAPKENFRVSEIIRMRRTFQDVFDRLGPNQQRVMFRFLNGFDNFNQTATKGLATKLDDIAARLGDTTYRAANANLSKFLAARDALKLNAGLDFARPSTVEDFMRGYLGRNVTVRQSFEAFDKLVPSTFADLVEKYAAAQSFKGANPNLLRVGAVFSFLGMGGTSDLASKLLRFGIGVGITTPAGLRLITKAAAGATKGGRAEEKRILQLLLQRERFRRLAPAVVSEELRRRIIRRPSSRQDPQSQEVLQAP